MALTSTSTKLEADNPCWGSPSSCDLPQLLSLVTKEDAIVYESDKYVVLDKPPDLRMDGPYPSTVHKLLTFWYPPPSLQGLSTDARLEAVLPHATHNSIRDNELRPCHQLDYATSGLLCVARSHLAASCAIQQWEERGVQKEYLAVVGGNLLEGLRTNRPSLQAAQIKTSLKQLELEYKQSRKRPRKDTFDGFQPAHALFQKFKATILPEIDSDQPTSKRQEKSKKRKHRSNPLTEEHWETIWKPVKSLCEKNPEAKVSLREMNWKQVGKTKVEWKRIFQETANIHNDLLRRILEGVPEDGALDLPMVFGEETVCEDEKVPEGENEEVIYIFCPIGQDPKSFAMKIPPPDQGTSKPRIYPKHMENFIGSPDLDYKPSLTKCTIRATGTYGKNGLPITKVQLLPLTGRRHQLRVHMALLGHPILGDATYGEVLRNTERSSKQDLTETQGDKIEDTTIVSSEAPSRMCLHSYILSLRLLSPIIHGGQDELVQLVAKDPFTINEQGNLDMKST